MLCGWLSWFEALNGRLIVSKLGTELLEFLELVWAICDSVWTVWAVCVVIYALNHVLMCV